MSTGNVGNECPKFNSIIFGENGKYRATRNGNQVIIEGKDGSLRTTDVKTFMTAMALALPKMKAQPQNDEFVKKTGMSTGTKVAIGLGTLAAVGFGVWALMKGKGIKGLSTAKTAAQTLTQTAQKNTAKAVTQTVKQTAQKSINENINIEDFKKIGTFYKGKAFINGKPFNGTIYTGKKTGMYYIDGRLTSAKPRKGFMKDYLYDKLGNLMKIETVEDGKKGVKQYSNLVKRFDGSTYINSHSVTTPPIMKETFSDGSTAVYRDSETLISKYGTSIQKLLHGKVIKDGKTQYVVKDLMTGKTKFVDSSNKFSLLAARLPFDCNSDIC